MDANKIWTVTRIAERVKAPRHRVEYIIETRGINPVGTAGIARVFDERDVDRIDRELRRMDEEQGGGAS